MGKIYSKILQMIKEYFYFPFAGISHNAWCFKKKIYKFNSKESNPENRLGGTISCHFIAMMQGIRIHRVHDVKDLKQAMSVFYKLTS